MTIRTYSSPEAFKQALEQPSERVRRLASGSRASGSSSCSIGSSRASSVLGDAATLKGGLVLELRLERARTTKDIDLRMVGSPEGVLAKLQETARRELGDFMTFEIGPDSDHPEIQNDGMQYDGLRFRAECKLAGKLYGQPFGVDESAERGSSMLTKMGEDRARSAAPSGVRDLDDAAFAHYMKEVTRVVECNGLREAMAKRDEMVAEIRCGAAKAERLRLGERSERSASPTTLWSEQAGVLSHQMAFALHGLSDALPAHVPLTSRRRILLGEPRCTRG